MLGAHGESQPVTEQVAALVTGLQEDVHAHMGTTYATFVPVSFTKQTVAGVNYRVKVQVGDDQHIQVVVFQPLPHTGKPAELTSAAAL